MTNVDLARVEFAFVTINHFFFVPITIGLAFLTALLQTRWHRTDDAAYLRLTRFFGALLVINVAIGVVTGIVQEFEFGMNWGAYSRLVGNVFGAPLAMEGLAASSRRGEPNPARPVPGTATGSHHPAGMRSGRPQTRMIGGYDEYRSRPGAVRFYLD